ncbi:hypothetical protein HZC21_00535 [Candidatus Peregrinibacteria bacterium]|nr:hypothetical protein [Candidatus Peregrinibacteria bacterium]
MKNINILVINPLWPHPNHSIRAANVVLFELISEFAKQQDVKVMFLKINKYNDPAPSDEENRGVELLQSQGVNILPAFTLPLTSAKKSALSRILFADLADFYPEIAYRAMTQEKIVSYKPDVLFIPWTEWMTALCADMPVLKFAYYGNPDAKSVLAMTEFNFKHGTISFFRYLIQKYFYKKFEKLHLKIL